ncbi:MAG: type II secretion system protein [Pseudomonadota bacterium]
MYRVSKPHAWSCDNTRCCGVTMVELLVTLAILSILAAVAMPYAETVATRGKETELRRVLRDMRVAIDRFNDDYRAGRMSRLAAGASENGYPRDMQVLVDGVESSAAAGGKLRYLRRIPADPFAERRGPAAQQWQWRGYGDDADTVIWNGKDVYDVHSASPRSGLDGSPYAQW